MSTNKSTNYNLHQWEGIDKFNRSEVNENFTIIDSELKSILEEALARQSAIFHQELEPTAVSGDLWIEKTTGLHDILQMKQSDGTWKEIGRFNDEHTLLSEHTKSIGFDEQSNVAGAIEQIKTTLDRTTESFSALESDFDRLFQTETPLTLYVRPTGTLLENEFPTIQAAVDSLPKLLMYNTVIEIIGTGHAWNEGTLRIDGFFAGTGGLSIDFKDKTNVMTGLLFLSRNTCDIYIRNGRINFTGNAASGTVGVQCFSNSYISVDRMILDGTNKVWNGVRSSRSYVYITNSEVYAKGNAIAAQFGSRFDVTGVIGEGGEYGLYSSQSSIVAGNGNAPTGLINTKYTIFGGQITGAWTHTKTGGIYDTSSGTTSPAPATEPVVKTTVTYNSIDAESWRSYGWRTEGEVYYSNWGHGNHKGLWFFDYDKIKAALAGKTIKSIRLKATRIADSGYNTPVVPAIGTHNYYASVQTSGAEPTISNLYTGHNVGIDNSQTVWFSLPVSFGNALRDGTAKGFGVFDSSPSMSEYMRLTKAAVLEITYEG